jgi:hypothetical protein
VIGVAKDAHYTGVRSEVKPTVYLPYTDSLTGLHQMTFVVRTVLPPLAIAGAGRLVVAATDRSMPVAEMKTEEQQIDESIATERLSPHSLARLAVSLRCCRHRALWRDGVRSSAANSRRSESGLRWEPAAPPSNGWYCARVSGWSRLASRSGFLPAWR